MQFDVLTLGEAMVLFAAEEPGPLAHAGRFRRYGAGAELNVAIGLARLGLRVGYLSRLGADSFGQFLLDAMTAEGVSTALVRSCGGERTGFMLKGRTLDGSDPEIEYHRRGSAASGMGPEDLVRLGAVRTRHLHLTGISPALSSGCQELVYQALGWARSQGAFVSFDPNLRPRLWPSVAAMKAAVNELAALCDLLLPGIEEGRLLTGLDDAEAIADHYLGLGACQVALKLGPRGAWCAGRDGSRQLVPGVPVPGVVDTVGAGDGFAAGVISGLLEGLALPDAALRGNRIGARVVQFPGDCDGLPTRRELDEAWPPVA
ncbi:sugar kinase [Ideonella sp. YS5]|uniref:sugar kinase n=1 Tax=Ideonella sp. YS5 TaxID=3453714 RepID=UPI003EEFEAB6